MASIANLIDHDILVEDDEDYYVPHEDWKLDTRGYAIYGVEVEGDGYRICREGKYEEPVFYTVKRDDDFEIDFFKRVDPEF